MIDYRVWPDGTVQAKEDGPAYSHMSDDYLVVQAEDDDDALQAGMRQALYADSTPHLHIGDSAFEDWFQQQPFACQPGIKQIARDAYAAGMGDPLVVAKT